MNSQQKQSRRRRRPRYRGPMPYRYDRRRPAWIPLSLVANGILLSWLGSSLVQPELYRQRQVLAFPLGHKLLSMVSNRSNWGNALAIQQTPRLAQNSGASGVRLTYDQWVEQLQQEASAIALQRASNLSILAGDSLSLWFPDNLLPRDQIWLNQGISGETSQGLMRRLGLWKGLQPQRIFVMIGINDLLKGTAPDQVLSNNRAIVRQLRQTHPKSDIVLQSVLPHSGSQASWEGRNKLARIPNAQILEFNRGLAAIARAEQVYYLDLNPLFADEKGFMRRELTTDGLHLNPQGYLVWSTAMNFFSLQELEDEEVSIQTGIPAAGPAETSRDSPSAATQSNSPPPERPAPTETAIASPNSRPSQP